METYRKKQTERQKKYVMISGGFVIPSVQNNSLTYGLGEKEARRPTPKWNTRFYLAFSIRA